MTRPARESLPYRDCVGVAIFNRGGEVFLASRKPDDDPEDTSEMGSPWQMPQGGIDPGESPYQCALREVYEETNMISLELIAEAPEWIYYDLPDELLGTALRGKYRGQRQRWFAFAFTGPESEIDVLAPGGGTEPPEFNAWRWEAFERTPGIVVDFKRDAYRRVVAAFAYIPGRFAR